MPYKAIVLDWDGTVVLSLDLKVENAAELFARRFGVAPDAVRRSYRRHSGIPRRELFERISEDCLGRGLGEAESAALSDAFTEANLRAIAGAAPLRPNLRTAVEAIRARSCVVVVSSSACPEELQALAPALGIATLFDELMGSRPGFSKGPEHVAHVRERYGVELDEIAAVGDEPRDMALFGAAGVAPIGITGTCDRAELCAGGASRVINDLIELLPDVG